MTSLEMLLLAWTKGRKDDPELHARLTPDAPLRNALDRWRSPDSSAPRLAVSEALLARDPVALHKGLTALVVERKTQLAKRSALASRPAEDPAIAPKLFLDGLAYLGVRIRQERHQAEGV